MTEKKSIFILVFITLFWGISFLLMKIGLNNLEPFNIIALRFGIAFILLVPVILKQRKDITVRLLIHSVIVGVLLFGVFACVLFSLKTTTTSNVGFLQSLTICFVPLCESIMIKRIPDWRTTTGVVLSTIGLGLLTIKQTFSIGLGDLLCIISAIIYTVHILYTDKVVEKENSLLIGILQLGVVGSLGFIFSLLFEEFKIPYTIIDWMLILTLAIFCSAIGFVGQTVSQKFTTPTKTGMIFSLEPIFAALFGYIFLREKLSFLGYMGGFFMIFGIIFANINPPNLFRSKVFKYLKSPRRLFEKSGDIDEI